jgi:hypothetical protein
LLAKYGVPMTAASKAYVGDPPPTEKQDKLL